MRVFGVKLLGISIVFLSILYVVDYLIQEGLKTSNYREISKYNEIIKGGIDADLLIVGSSRALVHFDCELIESRTGKSCYNLGFDGSSYPLQKIMLDLYLNQNQRPDYIYWVVDLTSFTFSSDFYGFEQLIPFMENNYINEILRLHKTPAFLLELPLIRYSFNSKMKSVGLYTFLGIYQRDKIIEKGYRPQEKSWDGLFDQFKNENPKGISLELKEEYFQDFLMYSQEIQNRGMSLSWVIAPYYYEMLDITFNSQEIIQKIQLASEDCEIPFLDFTNSPIKADKSNFYNAQHLNSKGVKLFVEQFMEIEKGKF